MGKCSSCGKKIEYNNYKVIDSLIYCPNCTPEEEPEVKKATEEAEEQFEHTMAGHGETAETVRNKIEEKTMPRHTEENEIGFKLKQEEKKPRKRRSLK